MLQLKSNLLKKKLYIQKIKTLIVKSKGSITKENVRVSKTKDKYNLDRVVHLLKTRKEKFVLKVITYTGLHANQSRTAVCGECDK